MIRPGVQDFVPRRQILNMGRHTHDLADLTGQFIHRIRLVGSDVEHLVERLGYTWLRG